MFNRRRALIIIIILGLLIISFIIYWLWFRQPAGQGPAGGTASTTPNKIEVSTSTPGSKPRNYQQYDISKEAPHVTNADDLGKVGMTFAGLFGSFSKQSNYGGIEDAKVFMTSDLQAWADTYIAKLRADNKDKVYYDIATTPLTYKAENFNASSGQAKITIETLRKESTEAVNNGSQYSQTLTLDFVKANGHWLVNAAYWGKK